jgi:hypothetical protein
MPDSPVNVLFCTKCRQELPAYIFRTEHQRPCPACGASIQGILFPSFFDAPISRPGQALLIDTDASCFYHPQKKAEVTCDYCGRFLCALCEVEIDGKKLCPPCIEAGKVKGRIKSLENRRVLYDSIALSLSIVPLLIFYLTFVTAPIALYMAIRYWNKPTSILHRGKWRFVLAILFSCAEIVGWGAVGYYLITRL